MAERVFIIIDGSNFYHRAKEAMDKSNVLLDLDYGLFARWLCGERTISAKKYYIGAVRAKPDDQKGQLLRRNQQKLFTRLMAAEWGIERGYILNSGGVRHEKGVDVHMAVDLLVGAYENLYDAAILVSSDTDLIPALKKVRSMGKRIEYVGFSHKPSYGLIAHSDIRRLLTKEDLQQFLP